MTCTVNTSEPCVKGSPASSNTVTIAYLPVNTISAAIPPGSENQNVCIDTPITPIRYGTTGATGATFSGLPAGVTGNWFNDTVTISGTPSVWGTFNYTVTLTGGCGVVTASGSITVRENNTIFLTSAVGTDDQTICIGQPIVTITYSTTGATGASYFDLPPGVTGNWAAGVVTINGTPTSTGTYNYRVETTGGCGLTSATGTITVNPKPPPASIYHN